MSRVVVAAIFSLIPIDAFAIVRYMVQDMTCAEVQEAVDRDGVAILYRKTTSSGLPLYDRYVRSEDFCDSGQTVSRTSVPAADTERCRVSKCMDETRFGR